MERADSLEVIVLVRDEDGVLRLPKGDGPAAGRLVPEGLPIDDYRLAKSMAATTISLPVSMNTDACLTALEKSLHYDTWQASPWLRGQIALVLDPSGTAQVGDFHCTYSDDLGLIALREGKDT